MIIIIDRTPGPRLKSRARAWRMDWKKGNNLVPVLLRVHTTSNRTELLNIMKKEFPGAKSISKGRLVLPYGNQKGQRSYLGSKKHAAPLPPQ